MKAMILAAGAGTRLKPLTNRLPKPMLPIIEKPVIEFILELLAKYDVKEIMINLSHLAGVLQNYVRSGYRYGVRVGYSFEGHFEKGQLVPEPVGSAGGLKKIQEESGFFDETFIVLCGDAIVDFDLAKAYEFHRASESIATIISKEVERDKVPNYGIIVCDSAGRVQSFQEKPPVEKAKSNLANTGIYIFEPEVFNYIPKNQFFDIGGELLPLLVQKKERVFSLDTKIDWYDIGRNSDYLEILGMALEGRIKNFKPSGREVTEGLWRGTGSVLEKSMKIITPVYVGAGSIVEKNVKLEGPVMIGANCRIHEGVELSNVFVGDYTRIKPGFKGKNLLITPEYYVSIDGSGGGILDSNLSRYVSDVRSFEGISPVR
ncbi:MAG: NDP-sugar synthase [Mesotoga sp.]|uniref:sugar phosphate nucleotidyltransferase n=1 Tax=Mesotoga sp. TaxID=2053577 RepID=UPI00356B4215